MKLSIRKLITGAFAIAILLPIAGCQSTSETDRAVGGGAIGGLLGGGIGALASHGSVTGTLAGAAIGAAGGAMVGIATTPHGEDRPCVDPGYDSAGHPFCFRYAPPPPRY